MHDPPNPKGSLHTKTRIVSWIAQLAAAVILGQTLFFKFSGAPESVQIFEQLGAEPWGRIGSGVMELVAVVLLLTPRLAALGGLLASGLMVGAIGSHLTRLGIEVAGDGGTLFAMAWVVLISGIAVAYLRRGQLPISGRRDAESRIHTGEAR